MRTFYILLATHLLIQSVNAQSETWSSAILKHVNFIVNYHPETLSQSDHAHNEKFYELNPRIKKAEWVDEKVLVITFKDGHIKKHKFGKGNKNKMNFYECYGLPPIRLSYKYAEAKGRFFIPQKT